MFAPETGFLNSHPGRLRAGVPVGTGHQRRDRRRLRVLASELVQHDRPESAFAAYKRRLRDYVEKNQTLALRTDSTVISRTSGQLLCRNIKLCLVPWLQRRGLAHLLQTQLRSAATDLSLSHQDRQRSTNPLQAGRTHVGSVAISAQKSDSRRQG